MAKWGKITAKGDSGDFSSWPLYGFDPDSSEIHTRPSQATLA